MGLSTARRAALQGAALLALAAAAPRADHLGRHERTLAGLETPVGLAVDAAGRLWIVERRAGRVRAFDREGREVARIGGDGSFLHPEGLAATPEGTLLLVDTGHHRVVEIGVEGARPLVLGGRGREPGRFLFPTAVAVDAKRIAVADGHNHRVQVFSRAGELLAILGEGELRHPAGICMDRRGSVYVADSGNDRIVKYDPGGARLAVFGDRGAEPGRLRGPAGLAYRDGRIHVADRWNHRAQVFDVEGRLLGEIGVPARDPHAGEGRLLAPGAIALHPEGTFAALSEELEGRVQIFVEAGAEKPSHADLEAAEEGSHVRFHGGAGSGAGLLAALEPEQPALLLFDLRAVQPQLVARLAGARPGGVELREPVDVAVHPEDGSVYLLDRGLRRVTVLEPARDEGGGYAVAPPRLRLTLDLARLELPEGLASFAPESIACDRRGRLVLGDPAAGVALLLDEQHEVEGALDAGGALLRLTDIAVLPTGELVALLDRDRGTVELWRRDGTCAGTREGFGDARGVAFGPEAQLAVLDAAGGRLLRFDAAGLPLATFGGPEDSAPGFEEPCAVAIHGPWVLVLEPPLRRGQVRAGDGRFVVSF